MDALGLEMTSARKMAARIWALPVSGTAFNASKGFMEERDSKETLELSCPGKWKRRPTRHPVASIATRPCLSSAARNHRRVWFAEVGVVVGWREGWEGGDKG